MGSIRWIEDRRQKAWLWIALFFASFYFGEAILFWGTNPRIAAPSFTPLIYWGSFGVAVVWLVRRYDRLASTPSADSVPPGMQATVLGLGITLSVIGMTVLVIRLTGNITLGHTILLLALCEAGLVIAGMSGSVGWLAAGLIWGCGAPAVFWFPGVQDVTLGLAVAIGFALIGLLRAQARASGDRAGQV
ncbi:MAG: hypothetical protein BIFFINMI_03645 [Phycisphaerae bacterium]|nr:hypothetical protein [Phycisphaerae bacterium]